MAVIEKMSVLGVRSFSNDHSQTISFDPPVTLIIGPNGSGKTSLIECLKYITTGDMPPGAKTSGAFVHDPKLVYEPEVKAKIQLKMRDIRGDLMIVARNVMATVKPHGNGVTMKTLDCSLKRQKKEGGQPEIINPKCVDLDRLMIDSLGVSKAILENVIFCHQEDSNWPLAEAKVLKQRFDDIFASTRYVKALEAIIKSRKEADGDLKIFNAEIKHLRQNVDRAEEEQRKFDEVSLELIDYRERKDRTVRELEPLQKQLDDYRKRQTHMIQLEDKVKQISRDRERELLTVRELRDVLKDAEFIGSDRDLEEEYNRSTSRANDIDGQLNSMQRTKETCERRREQLSKAAEALHVRKGRLQQEASRARQEEEILQETAAKLGAGVTDPNQVVEQLERSVNSETTEGRQRMRQLEQTELAAQGHLTAALEARTKAKQTLEMKRETFDENERAIRDKRDQLRHAADAAERLVSISRRVRASEQQLAVSEEQSPAEELRKNEEQLKEECTNMRTRISAVENQLDIARQETQIRNKIESLQADIINRRKTNDKLRNKNRDNLNQLMVGKTVSKGQLRRQLEKVIEKVQDEHDGLKQIVDSERKSLHSKEANHQYIEKDIEEKELQKKNLESKMRQLLEGEPSLDVALDEIQEKRRRVEDQKAEVQGSVHAFKKFREKLLATTGHGDCPLCHRGFECRAEKDALVAELEQLERKFPKELKSKEQELVRVARRETDLIRMQPEEKQLRQLKDSDLPELRNKADQLSSEILNLRKSVAGQGEMLSLKADDLKLAQEIIPDVTLIDNEEVQLQKLESEVQEQRGKLQITSAGQGVMKTESELQENLKNMRSRLDGYQNELEETRVKLQNCTERLQKIRDNYNKLKEEELQIRSDIADESKVQADVEQLTQSNTALETEINELRAGMGQLETAVNTAQNELQKCKNISAETAAENQRKVAKLQDDLKELRQRLRDVQRYKESGKIEQLARLERELTDNIKEAEDKRCEVDEANVQIDELRQQKSRLGMRKRELEDCKKLRRSETLANDLEIRLAELRRELGNLDVESLERMLPQLRDREEALLKEGQRLMLEIAKKETKAGEHRTQLQTPQIRDAEKKHREKLYELRVTEMVSTDLQKYYRALDAAIMRYHASKMEEINRIVRELWMGTYRHNDIDCIKVCADEETSSSNKMRRTFNYRMVMIKNGVELDMRGRTSAGQRVLTSLIIRLALAETFGINCGVLALDEPTTNLDRDNIESLADSLVEIVKARREQRNFQLVIITHDEEFLRAMADNGLVEFYYRLSRNRDGFSRVQRHRYSDSQR